MTVILDTFDPKTGPLTPDYGTLDIDDLASAAMVGDEQAVAELQKRIEQNGKKDMDVDTAGLRSAIKRFEAKIANGFVTEDKDLMYWETPEFKRNFSQEQRDKFAKEGVAMPDGSYPIPDGGALRRAIASFGRATDPAATKKHIIKRAQALHLTWMLPKDWNVGTDSGSNS